MSLRQFFLCLTTVFFVFACSTTPTETVVQEEGQRGPASRGALIYTKKQSGNVYQVVLDGKPMFQVTLLTGTSFRLHNLNAPAWPEKLKDYMIVKADSQFATVNASEDNKGAEATIKTAAGLSITMKASNKSSLEITVDHVGTKIIENWLIKANDKISTLSLRAGENIYGFGDKRAAFDQRGQDLDMVNNDAYASTDNDSYKSVPFYMSTAGYGMFFHNFYPSNINVGKGNSKVIRVKATDGGMDFYVFAGEPKQIISQYTEITGRPAMIPRWAYGFNQSRAPYKKREGFTVAEEMRKRGLAMDAIYYDDWQQEIVTAEAQKEMWDKYRTRITIGGNPFLIQHESNDDQLFTEMSAKKYLWVDQAGNAIMEDTEEIASGDERANASYIDFFNPQAVSYFFDKKWAQILKNGLVYGMSDFGEFSHVKNADKKFFPSINMPVSKVRNMFALAYGAGMSENARKFSSGRSTGMVRPGFAGSQRFGWTTTCDSEPSYKNWRFHIRAMMNLSMTGFSNVGQDIGGWGKVNFTSTGGEEAGVKMTRAAYETLYSRWFAAGTFHPFMWAHGEGPHEPYAHGEKVEAVAKSFLNLRYRLLPHIYTLGENAHRTGVPILRPMPMQEPNDLNCRKLEDQYFMGDDMLVAPVLNDQGDRKVYLPQGAWYEFFNDQILAGEKNIEVKGTPLNRIPLYIKAGAIIPMGPAMAYAEEEAVDPLSVHYYAVPSGNHERRYDLYEDDGLTEDYKKGEYQFTTLSMRQSAQGLTFNSTVRGGMNKERSYTLELHGVPANWQTITLNGSAVTSGNKQQIKTETASWGREGKTLWVFVPKRKPPFTIEVR